MEAIGKVIALPERQTGSPGKRPSRPQSPGGRQPNPDDPGEVFGGLDYRRAPGFRRRTFGSFEAVPGTEEALIACQELAESWQGDGRGLALVGRNGCGKTHLAVATLHEVNRKDSTLFLRPSDLVNRLRQSFRSEEHGGVTPQTIEWALWNVGLLVLDDLGSEALAADDRGDWKRDALWGVIDHRIEWRTPTIITLNLSQEALEDRLGMRILSRIKELCRVIPVEAADYRER